MFGHRSLTLGLLIAGVVCFLILTAHWILKLVPPSPYMYWLPVLILSGFFFVNLATSLLTKRYLYIGNFVFHAGIIVIAAGVALSYFTRFEGNVILTEGDIFFGEKKEYASYFPAKGYDNSKPDVSFRLDKIVPEFWQDKLHFTRLDGILAYPATTLKNRGVIRLNGGLKMDGASVRIASFGYALNLILEDMESGKVERRKVRLNLFPPGAEDSIPIKDDRIYFKVLPDPVEANGRLQNKSMNLVDPALIVTVKRSKKSIREAVLKNGEAFKHGSLKLTFKGIKYWSLINVVKDPAIFLIITGLVALIAGLFLRLMPLKRG